MKGYTLIEVIIAVMLMAIILLGGTALFYQDLKSAGLSDLNSKLNNTLSSILASMEKEVRYSQITGVDESDRIDCVNAGPIGITGETLSVSDLGGYGTTYAVLNNKVASTSADTGVVTYLNKEDVNIKSMEVTWYCATNISDKIKIVINGSSNSQNIDVEIDQSATTEINLLNSGLN